MNKKHRDFGEILNQDYYAEVLFAADCIKCRIEDELEEIYGDLPLNIWWDYYDQSLEIGFSDRTPQDFQAGEALVEAGKEWGFSMIYLNFTDNSQQILYPLAKDGKTIYPRKVYGNNSYRWTKEKADQYE